MPAEADPRAPLLALASEYRERFPDEQVMVDRFLDFVSGTAACFERSHAAGHVTGSAWLLDTTGTRALLTHHRKLNIWVQLGGHADGDPDVLGVARREAEEESGLPRIATLDQRIFDIDIHEIPARKNEAAHFHYDCRFLLQAVDSDTFAVSEESHDLAWIELTRVGEISDEASLARMVIKTPRGIQP